MNILRKFLLPLAAFALSADVWASGSDSVYGPVINPTPHSLELAPDGERLDISGGVRVMDRHEAFAGDVDFIAKGDKRSVRLNLDFHHKKAVKAGVQPVSGAYLLTVSEDGISITDRGTEC